MRSVRTPTGTPIAFSVEPIFGSFKYGGRLEFCGEALNRIFFWGFIICILWLLVCRRFNATNAVEKSARNMNDASPETRGGILTRLHFAVVNR